MTTRRSGSSGGGCGTVLLVLVLVLVVAGVAVWKLGFVDRWLYESAIEQQLSTMGGDVSEGGPSQGAASADAQGASEGASGAGPAAAQLPAPYVYATLGEDDRAKYRIVYDVLSSREARTYPETDMDDLSRIRDCVLADHPELFYVNGMRLLTTTNAASGLVTDVTVEGQYEYGEAESAALWERALDAVDACLAGLPEAAASDDYLKAKYCYEYVAANTEYDHKAALLASGAQDDGRIAAGQTLVDVFVDGRAVCGGYASAFQYLMQRLGVQCAYVSGEAMGGRHAWNLCMLDGSYYYIDPTWGDPQFTDAEGAAAEMEAAVNYDYLGATTEDVLKTHVLSDLFELPLCVDSQDSYYVREGLLFDWPDEARLGQLASEALAEGRSLQVRCTDEATYRDLLDYSVATGQLASYLPQNSYRYSHSDELLTIAIYDAS